VDAATLAEATHSVTASATDAAQNTGTRHQVLSVDLTVPVVTIDGGATRATDDTSPWTYGTTAEQAGTTVHVSIGGQALTATVLSGGTWGVSAETLTAGTYTVVASVTDAAQNTGTATQTVTVGPMAPPTPVPPVPVPPVPVPAPVPTVPAPASPTSEPRYQPDAAIGPLHGALVGAGSYDASQQRVTRKLRGKGRNATFEVRVTNRGDATDRMTIRGTSKSQEFKVTYTAGGKNVTPAVASGTYLTNPLAPGASAVLIVTLTRTKAAGTGDRRTFEVRTSSSHAPAIRDTVSAVVQVAGKAAPRGHQPLHARPQSG
jgi:hypothetical protein